MSEKRPWPVEHEQSKKEQKPSDQEKDCGKKSCGIPAGTMLIMPIISIMPTMHYAHCAHYTSAMGYIGYVGYIGLQQTSSSCLESCHRITVALLLEPRFSQVAVRVLILEGVNMCINVYSIAHANTNNIAMN